MRLGGPLCRRSATKRGDVPALQWANSQPLPARESALLGVAEGILEQAGVKRQDNICQQALAYEWVSLFIVC